MKHLASAPSIFRVPMLQTCQRACCCAPNARMSVSASSRVRRRDTPTDPVPTDTELWQETSSVTSNAQRVVRYLVHAPWRLNTCSAEHSDVDEKCWMAYYPDLGSCDSSRGRTRSNCRSDEMHESSFPYLTPQCWEVSEDFIAKYSTVRLSHWDEHVELLAGVAQHHCFQLVHDASCPAPGRCWIWFEWVCWSSTHLRCDILKPHFV